MPERRGLAEKRRAILTGARAVFSRDGYTRASVDAIAAEASVSSRTIYNHFGDKETLFLAVIQDSATRVAEAQIAVIDRHFAKVTDLEADLIAFGRVWATQRTGHPEHFALVRQVNAELVHIPRAALEGWLDAGPRRVQGELGRRLARLADRGLLAIDDPVRAAGHLIVLVSTEVANRSLQHLVPLPEAEVEESVAAGVRAFLRGYLRTS